MEGAGPPAAAR